MKANYCRAMSRTEAHKIAKQEVTAMYDQVFAECAEDVMQQTLANVLLCLERDYDWRKQRLENFVKNLQGWCDIMQHDTDITKAWSTNDNIEYFKDKYGIDLREEFKAEVK
jgi:hypothetical protein